MRTHKMLTCKHFIPSLVYLNDKKPAEYISTIWNPKGDPSPNGFMLEFTEISFHELFIYRKTLCIALITHLLFKKTCYCK